jgi:hypothetical protein
MDLNSIMMYLSMALVINFTWYYLTLPGNVLSANNSEEDKKCKLNMKKSFLNWFLFIIPSVLLIIYNINSTMVTTTNAMVQTGGGLISKQLNMTDHVFPVMTNILL